MPLLICSLVSFTTKAEKEANAAQNDINKNATIRFYKVNKHKQTSKIAVSKKKTSATGCHNFSRSRRVLTLVQTGFSSCSVYTQKNCQDSSLTVANHSKSDGYKDKLTQGPAWLIKKQSSKDTKGVKLQSWSCH